MIATVDYVAVRAEDMVLIIPRLAGPGSQERTMQPRDLSRAIAIC